MTDDPSHCTCFRMPYLIIILAWMEDGDARLRRQASSQTDQARPGLHETERVLPFPRVFLSLVFGVAAVACLVKNNNNTTRGPASSQRQRETPIQDVGRRQGAVPRRY